MQKIMLKTISFLVLLGFGLNVQAGHLFTQDTPAGTDINLTAGFGIDIPQASLQPSNSNSSTFYVQGFESGDILRIILGSEVLVFDFDAMPAGWSASATTISTSSDDDLEALNLTAPFTWRADVLAGSVTLQGAVTQVSPSSRIIGTLIEPGSVTQSAVTATGSAPPAPTGPAQPVPVFSPAHLLLLIAGLAAVVGARRKFLRGG